MKNEHINQDNDWATAPPYDTLVSFNPKTHGKIAILRHPPPGWLMKRDLYGIPKQLGCNTS